MSAHVDRQAPVYKPGMIDQVGPLVANTADEVARARRLVERVAPELLGMLGLDGEDSGA